MNSKTIAFLFLFLTSLRAESQSYIPYYGSIVNTVNYDSIYSKLNTFESLGVKEFGTVALTNTQNWIVEKYTEYGYSDISLNNFTYFGQNLSNIVVTKLGTLYPDQFVIIDAHYDTKNGKGTNDNGSGTAILLELARLIKNVPTEYSIKFIHFTAEEIGLVGSENYVNTVVIPENLDIKILFNIDEVGGVAGMTNDIIVCERDESMTPSGNNALSAQLTDELATCVELYSNLTAEISYAYSSDYVPFEDNGEIITGFFEKNYSPHSHTATDLLINLDPIYVFEVAKAAMGGLLHYAIAYDISGLFEAEEIPFTVYPNPSAGSVTITSPNETEIDALTLYDYSGKKLMEITEIHDATVKIDLSLFDAGIYFLELNSGGKRYLTKLALHGVNNGH